MIMLLHGLGQRANSWDETIAHLSTDAKNLDLYEFGFTYQDIYKGFVDYCKELSEPIHLVGLSLGGMLALNYAADYPEKVASLVVVGAQYKIPTSLMAVQGAIFKLLPPSMFQKMGLAKADFIALLASASQLDLTPKLSKITCRTLVVCGTKDKPNQKTARNLSEKLAHGTLKWVKNANHEVNNEQPAALAELINEFYEEESTC